MRDAFLANQVRGTDSSGIFQVTSAFHKVNPEIRTFKSALCGSYFVDSKDAHNIINYSDVRALTVGHVRASTQGATNDENAHPFIIEREDGSKLVGVHNGTLDVWRSRTDADKFDVDSHWLYYKLAKDGIDAFAGFSGAYALVWYDTRHPDQVFVARNTKRPLFWALTSDQKSLVAASEMGMIGWLAGRNGITLHTDKEGNVDFRYPEAGFLYTINLKDPRIMTKQALPEVSYNKYLKPYTAPASTSLTPYRSHYSRASRRDADYYDDWDGVWDDRGTSWSNQGEVLEKIKKAVDNGRLLNELAASIEEAVADAVDSVENEAPSNGAVDVKDLQWYHNPHTANTRKEEVIEAQHNGLFGMLVNMVVYFYDNTSGILYGDFRVESGGVVKTYDCIIRGLATKEADAMVSNAPDKFQKVVVTGINRQVSKNGKPWVVVEPTYKLTSQNVYKNPPSTNKVVNPTELADQSHSVH